MGKIYTLIYLTLVICIVVVLILILKELLKHVPVLTKIGDTAGHMQNNLDEMNKKTEYINSVKNKVFTPNTKKIITHLWLISSILSDLKDSKEKPLKYAVKKIMK